MTTARVVSSMWRVEREPDDIVHGTDKFHDYLLPRLAPLVDEVIAFDLLRPHLSQDAVGECKSCSCLGSDVTEWIRQEQGCHLMVFNTISDYIPKNIEVARIKFFSFFAHAFTFRHISMYIR